MNVSMMDSYNLAWKLAYCIHGVTPTPLLETYETERRAVAQQLLEADKIFSTAMSQPIANTPESGDAQGPVSKQLDGILSALEGFISGCGIQYPGNMLVELPAISGTDTDHLCGILHPGTRVANVKLKRYADGAPRDLQDSRSCPFPYPHLHPYKLKDTLKLTLPAQASPAPVASAS